MLELNSESCYFTLNFHLIVDFVVLHLKTLFIPIIQRLIKGRGLDVPLFKISTGNLHKKSYRFGIAVAFMINNK